MSLLLLIFGLIMFVALVVVHEFGHFIVARRNGVEVEEFGIGFPPRAKVLARKNGTVYTLNWLPLGGFVRLKGEHTADTDNGTFGAASIGVKSKIMIAGVAMNLATAFVLLTLLALLGMPKIIDNQYTYAKDTKVLRNDVFVAEVEPGSPAEKAGIRSRDRLVSINNGRQTNNIITSAEKLPDFTHQFAGQEIDVAIVSAGKAKNLKVTLRQAAEVEASKNTDKPLGYMGIVPTDYTLQRSTWSAPIVAAGLIKQFTFMTFEGLGKAAANLVQGHGKQASEGVAGPIGIFVLLKDGSELGYQFIFLIIAIISLTLAIMNALPIPALDGGRLFVTWAYKLAKKPLSKRREDMIHGTGFALLMVLFVLITIVDVKRNF